MTEKLDINFANIGFNELINEFNKLLLKRIT